MADSLVTNSSFGDGSLGQLTQTYYRRRPRAVFSRIWSCITWARSAGSEEQRSGDAVLSLRRDQRLD